MTKAVYEAVSVVRSLSFTTTHCAAANPRRVRVQIAHRLSVPLLDFVYERLGSTPPRPAVLANYINMLQAFTLFLYIITIHATSLLFAGRAR